MGSYRQARDELQGDGQGEDGGGETISSTTPAGLDCAGLLIRWNAQKTFGVIVGYSDRRAATADKSKKLA